MLFFSHLKLGLHSAYNLLHLLQLKHWHENQIVIKMETVAIRPGGMMEYFFVAFHFARNPSEKSIISTKEASLLFSSH